MNYFTAGLLILLVVTVRSEEMPTVTMQTNVGTIVLELNPDKAQKTVANFLRYAQDGFYEGTIFHRVIRNYIIQGGAYTQDNEKKPPLYDPIPNESDNGLENVRTTIAMARNPDDPDSATSQFFINVKDNDSLDYQSSLYSDWGYAVFGSVIEGMNVVDKIQAMKTGKKGSDREYVPKELIIIESVMVENVQAKPKVLLSSDIDATDVAETEKDSFDATEVVETEKDTLSATKTEKTTQPTGKSTPVASFAVEKKTDTFSPTILKKPVQPAKPKVPALSAPTTFTTEAGTDTVATETTNVAETNIHRAAQTPTMSGTFLSPSDPPSQPEKPEPLPD